MAFIFTKLNFKKFSQTKLFYIEQTQNLIQMNITDSKVIKRIK